MVKCGSSPKPTQNAKNDINVSFYSLHATF